MSVGESGRTPSTPKVSRAADANDSAGITPRTTFFSSGEGRKLWMTEERGGKGQLEASEKKDRGFPVLPCLGPIHLE